MPITPEALYIQLGQFIAETPDLRNHGWNNPEGQRWLGRATVLVEAAGDMVDALNFKTTAQNLSSNPYIPGHDDGQHQPARRRKPRRTPRPTSFLVNNRKPEY
jgi:hypothetical protein